MVLKKLILNNFYVGGLVVLTELVFTISTLGGCCSLERTDFKQFLLWKGVVVLTELVFCLFYFGRLWWS